MRPFGEQAIGLEFTFGIQIGWHRSRATAARASTTGVANAAPSPRQPFRSSQNALVAGRSGGPLRPANLPRLTEGPVCRKDFSRSERAFGPARLPSRTEGPDLMEGTRRIAPQRAADCIELLNPGGVMGRIAASIDELPPSKPVSGGHASERIFDPTAGAVNLVRCTWLAKRELHLGLGIAFSRAACAPDGPGS